jgi:hypothetical protein
MSEIHSTYTPFGAVLDVDDPVGLGVHFDDDVEVPD